MLELTAAQTNPKVTFPWLFGAKIDLFFFFASILFGFAVYGLTQSPVVANSVFLTGLAASALGAGPFHQGPTLFTYFDKKNLNHYASTWRKQAIFFLAPPLIFAWSLLGAFYYPAIVVIVYSLWTLQHLVQQNIGILLLYHNHGKGEAIVDRKLEMSSQWSGIILFTLVSCARFNFLGLKNFPGLNFLIAVALIWFVIRCTQYLWELSVKVRAGQDLNAPAFMFWLLSVLCMSPCAFIGTSYVQVLLIPLTFHWFQYIGLNYVLVGRKYQTAERANLPGKHPIMMFSLFCAVTMVVLVAVGIYSPLGVMPEAWQSRLLVGIILGCGHVHYFLDAFIWRFREPYNRQAILPYLVSR